MFPKSGWMLSSDFIGLLEASVGADRSRVVLGALEGDPVVSVRANTSKIRVEELASHFAGLAGDAVRWAPDEGFYLDSRPSFTTDPLFHAGAYYVQEASSMYVGGLVGAGGGRMILDLCASPGGKSTHILSKMASDDLLVANETVSSRAGVLASNIAKWGAPNAVVTNNDPSAFSALDECFDIVLVDAPCSGEGMFRKDDEAVSGWSLDNVNMCAARQRRIVGEVWPALKAGGTLIYSTCTFNHFEDEDNARWICSHLGAHLESERRFLPGIDRGEGFYCAVIRKDGDLRGAGALRFSDKLRPVKDASEWLVPGFDVFEKGDLLKACPQRLAATMHALELKLKVIHSGVAVAMRKGRDLVPAADLAVSTVLRRGVFPECDLDLPTALKYLSREPVVTPDAPQGFVLMTFKGYPLGFVKNLGSRTNNLYPQALRIRMRLG